MTNFNNLPHHIQLYIFEYNPEHREQLQKVHENLFRDFHIYNMSWVLDELIMKQTITCDYEYCEADIAKCEAVEDSLPLPENINLKHTFHFCNDECKSAGMYWIMDDYRKFLRGWNVS